jgi:NAD(P)-dependent dehydrogenase (short-subunit alcohol dehydrogenase family)
VSNYGRIDVLVNNAGVIDGNQGVGELTDAPGERVIGINLDGPMYTSRKAVQHMLRQGCGDIIRAAGLRQPHLCRLWLARPLSAPGVRRLADPDWRY